MSHRIEVPARCPECDYYTCLLRDSAARTWTVHCGGEHEGKQDCDWQVLVPLNAAPGEDVIVVAV